MPWGKNDDRIRGNPKLRAAGKAVRGGLMMIWGYCAEQPTDGWVPEEIARQELTERELAIATAPLANSSNPLLHKPGDTCRCLLDKDWKAGAGGYWVHDWLDYNPSKAENDVHRAKRKELGSKELRRLVRARDGNACRYCGLVSSWAVHRGPKALQVEHIDPRLADGLSNLVVSCKECNLRKGKNTPEAAGMDLLPPPVEVPEGGWKSGDEETIERAWPTETDDPTDDRTAGSDPVEPPDPTGDPSAVDHSGTSAPAAGDETAGTTVDATPDASYLGAGGAGVPPVGAHGSPGARARVGPATTPRSALAPNPYFKANTSNPSPAVVETMNRLGCSLAEAEHAVAKTINRPDPRAGPP